MKILTPAIAFFLLFQNPAFAVIKKENTLPSQEAQECARVAETTNNGDKLGTFYQCIEERRCIIKAQNAAKNGADGIEIFSRCILSVPKASNKDLIVQLLQERNIIHWCF